VYGVGYGAEEEKWAEARAIAVSQHLAFPFKIYIQYALKRHIWLNWLAQSRFVKHVPLLPYYLHLSPIFASTQPSAGTEESVGRS